MTQRTDDGLPVPARRNARMGLAIIAALELVTLLTLLVNLATAHDPTLAKIVGPTHGTFYLLGVLLAWRTTNSPRVRVLSIVPLLGAFLAWRSLPSAPASETQRS